MNKEILRLAIPNILSNISIPLISSVDTLLMGQLSAAHLGAVGVGSMIFNFIYWNFGFLRMGTTGITAQAYGRKDAIFIINTLSRALLVAIILAGLILLLQIPFANASFYLMNIAGEQYGLVEEYFYIRIWAAPATLGLYAIMGWYFGMQNAIFPLILTIVINVVNIIFSYYFVVYLDWEVAGVAWGTVLSQYIGLLLGVILFLKKYSSLLQSFKQKAAFQIDELKQFLTINRDIFIRTVCLTLAFGFFYSQSSAGGELVLAANVILLQFLNWMSYAVDGFAYAAESLVGKYKGAADDNKTNQSIHYSFYWGFLMAVLFSLSYYFFGENLIGIFTDKEEVITAALPFLIWMIIFPILSTPSYIWDGIYIGLTASKAMRDSMLLSFLIYLGSFFILKNVIPEIHALWLALLLFLVARGVFQWAIFRKKGLQIN